MQRLRINNGRYQGECIDIESVLKEIDSLARASGWEPAPIAVSRTSQLPAYQLIHSKAERNIYISSGIHGDEPAGPLAALELFKQAPWPAGANIWLIPCLNPDGFKLNWRGDKEGVDLNRDYRSPKTATVRAHTQWLRQRPRFSITLLLHEDWEADGFYLYELNPAAASGLPSGAEEIVNAVREVCPIDMSPEIEGRPASNGIICANPDLPKRPDWPEAFYLIHHKTRVSLTLEAPSDYDRVVRVAALVQGVKAAL